MGKLFTALALALAAGLSVSHAAAVQSANTRVGPTADEKPLNNPAPGPKDSARRISIAPPSPTGKSPDSARQKSGGISPSRASDSAVEKKGSSEAGADSPVNSSSPPAATTPAPTADPAIALTSIYRVGAGDVLDIRLLNLTDSRQSTLFTILAGGILEYPLLTSPLVVSGLTVEEVTTRLIAELRQRGVYERPQVNVNVRDYASHAVLVSGLVAEPGTKIIRREAVPLYVVIAEAQPKPEAGRAIVTSHATGKSSNVDLNDASGMGVLVQQGDVISVVVRPPEFFYVGGEISVPGQKDFHSGITLTQAILASGGTTKLAGPIVKVSRQRTDGRLVSAEYKIKEIEDGLVPDPALQAGDRIEISRGKK
jgi:protein involved in polysaccharide export with SLBB domain